MYVCMYSMYVCMYACVYMYRDVMIIMTVLYYSLPNGFSHAIVGQCSVEI